ncbi:MAG TPA: hypothetical protein VGO11_18745 [Chthoniobacteraceae bacterium]|jgi:hypothetical protein|nr:hypothetical protein [Chthoniobacteraceae bacterium]
MENPIVEQYLIGAGCIALGLLAWLLPYRWNFFRFRRFFAKLLSESANMRVPKIIGSLLILVGLAIVIATAVTGKFD